MVFAVANGMFRSAFGQGRPWSRLTDRMVKYIANSAAKNMSSEDNQTIVPTLTRLGRRDACGAVVVVIADAVATPSIIAANLPGRLFGGLCCRVWSRAGGRAGPIPSA
ncbi:hypothetical protein GCM10009555_024690 [Acrocarpospora macrocephala]|uniref:Uncharacterized protein n=1 Tax=Acrocarpospora macrocephala TaxID=150177 RepID=A0A5M3WSV2_9ACTN|nr:hypothetical protein Amac_039980 [Acrocarpospora macrocephala]